MDSSISGKVEIWFLSVCHHVPHELYYVLVDFRTFDLVLVANVASVLPENRVHALPWTVESSIISFWENWVTIVKRLAFQFRVVVMHPTPVTCDSSVHKIIIFAFVGNE